MAPWKDDKTSNQGSQATLGVVSTWMGDHESVMFYRGFDPRSRRDR